MVTRRSEFSAEGTGNKNRLLSSHAPQTPLGLFLRVFIHPSPSSDFPLSVLGYTRLNLVRNPPPRPHAPPCTRTANCGQSHPPWLPMLRELRVPLFLTLRTASANRSGLTGTTQDKRAGQRKETDFRPLPGPPLKVRLSGYYARLLGGVCGRR